MKFDSFVFLEYIIGSIFLFLGTLIRFSFSATAPGKIVRLKNAVKVVGLRKKTPDSFGMLMQFTGLLCFLFGTAYGIVLRRFVIEGLLSDCLYYFVYFMPLVLLFGAIKFLEKYYWQSQK